MTAASAPSIGKDLADSIRRCQAEVQRNVGRQSAVREWWIETARRRGGEAFAADFAARLTERRIEHLRLKVVVEQLDGWAYCGDTRLGDGRFVGAIIGAALMEWQEADAARQKVAVNDGTHRGPDGDGNHALNGGMP